MFIKYTERKPIMFQLFPIHEYLLIILWWFWFLVPRSCARINIIGVEIWSYIWMPVWYKNMHANFCSVPNYLDPLIPTLAKMHDGVSLLTNLSELKFDYRVGCPFDREACSPNFTTLWAIFTPFNPNLGETAQRIFTFNQFLGIKIWS